MTLGEKLVQLRRARGQSQEALAEAIGVSRQAVSKWELDAAAPEIDKIVALAEYYGVTTDYLLREDGAAATPQAAQPSGGRREASPIPSLGVSLAGCAVGLLLQYHGRFVSASEWPSLVGLILQVLCFVCGLTCFVQLRHNDPAEGGRFLRLYLRLSIWLVAPMPCMFCARVVFLLKRGPFLTLLPFAVGMALYFAVCGAVTAWSLRKPAS